MLIEALIYPISGFLMKISDDAWDMRRNYDVSIIAGIICGILLGILVTVSSDAAQIFFGIFLGTLLAGKVDSPPHFFTAIIFLLVVFILGMPSLSIFMLICALAAYMDEIWHENSVYFKNILIKKLFEYRCVLKIVVGILAFINVFQLETFFYFLLFEISYEIAKFI